LYSEIDIDGEKAGSYMGDNLVFRSWFYFRMGWSTYFVFFLGAINTLTVTYFLAIENYPSLKAVFPSFEEYVLVSVFVLITALVFLGFAHYKKTKAFKSEIDVQIESNPYQRRNTVNGEINLRLSLKLLSLLMKFSKKEIPTDGEIEEVKKLYDKVLDLSEKRNFTNDLDLIFLQKEIRKI